MELKDITPLILTYNEEANIRDTLERLYWAEQIILLDSFSTDKTLAVASSFPNVTIHQHEFSTHAAQWNHGLSLVNTTWVLTLDADYKVSNEFVTELQKLPNKDIAAFVSPLVFVLYGRTLNCSVLPPRPVLFDTERCSYFDDGHTQRLTIDGPSCKLLSPILHADKKAVGRWYHNQVQYADLEARKLLDCTFSELTPTGKLRRIAFLMCIVSPLYILFCRGGIFEFWQGWAYAALRGIAEFLISLALIKHCTLRVLGKSRKSSQN